MSIQAQILNLLADLRAQLALSMIFISHDLHVVRYIAPKIAVMFGGGIVEMLPPRRSARERPTTRIRRRSSRPNRGWSLDG